ncbi:ankyrin repeat-containing domain protein [Xylogone sp. PMI_703]|nr:ankyrin repeat-containing domain protein [Xylogone sp. PMI_703]
MTATDSDTSDFEIIDFVSPGTGKWIQETRQFEQWHSSDSYNFIWIKGIPGAGKSVLAASMIDSLKREYDGPVLFFFFRQIIEDNFKARSLIQYIDRGDNLESISTTQLWRHLPYAFSFIDKVYCVVDALDEMSTDEKFLAMLNELGTFRPRHIKLLITSRPTQYLQRLLKNAQVVHFESNKKFPVSQGLEELNVDSKTQSLVRHTICERSQELFLYAHLMLEQIKQTVKEQSKKDIAWCRQMVPKLPLGLEEMYNQVLFDHATKFNISLETQMSILQLGTHSARPLRLIEVVSAIETSSYGSNFTIKDRNSKEIVRTTCGPLLEIMEDEVIQILHQSFREYLLDSSRLERQSGTSQFPIIDPTVAHKAIALTCLATLQIPVLSEHSEPAKVTRIRRQKVPSQDRSYTINLSSIVLQYPFVEYAASNWMYHARQYNAEADPVFFSQLLQFCTSDTIRFETWQRLLSPNSNDSPRLAPNAGPLHVGAAYGLSQWVIYLIRNGADLDAFDSAKSAPLSWAARGGWSEVVKILLENGAQPDISKIKPIQVAAQRNHSAIIKFLLEAADTYSIGALPASSRFAEDALGYASKLGHTEGVLEMVLYVSREDIEEALCNTAAAGHSDLVYTLLSIPDPEKQPSSNAISRPQAWSTKLNVGGQPVLNLAVRSLDIQSVRFLLERGAIVSVKGRPDDTMNSHKLLSDRGQRLEQLLSPLHILATSITNPAQDTAAREILRLLLAAGANLETRNDEGNTPLLSTIANKSYNSLSTLLTSIQIFLDAGADPNVENTKNGETLLFYACTGFVTTDIAKQIIRWGDSFTLNKHCSGELIELMIGHGTDINVQDSEGNTVLHVACKGHNIKSKSIRKLLHLGCHPNIRNKDGYTPLHIFQPRLTKIEVVREILDAFIDAGADLEIRDNEGETILQRFVTMSCTAKFRDSLTVHGGKAVLHLALQPSIHDAYKILHMLLEYGADPTWTDDDGNTLLHEIGRRFRGSDEDIRLTERLIECGVPLHSLNKKGRTAAHIISTECRKSRQAGGRDFLFTILQGFDPTFDINAPDLDGYTPLHLAAVVSEPRTFSLIQAGADPLARSHNGRIPLWRPLAAPKCNVNATDTQGRTPLHDACRSGCPGSVRILLDASADFDALDFSNCTPLVTCAEFIDEQSHWNNNDLLMVENPNKMSTRTESERLSKTDEFRHICFKDIETQDECIYGGNREKPRIGAIAKMLIDAGADTKGALEAAVQAGDIELLAALKSKGALRGLDLDIDEPSTAHLSKQSENDIPNIIEPTMDALVEKGVDFTKPLIPYSDELIAISKLVRYGMTEFVEKIISKAKLFDDPSFTNALANEVQRWSIIRPLLQVTCSQPFWNMEMVKLLVTKGHVDVNAHRQIEDKDYRVTGNVIPGLTALHVLAIGRSWWQIEAIQYLICNGADINSIDDEGQTPLDIASTHIDYGIPVEQGFFAPQCCELLLKAGADANRVSPRGLTPLNRAGIDHALIKVLLKYGADINAGPKGALLSAIEKGDVVTLKQYLEAGSNCNIPYTSTEVGSYLTMHRDDSLKEKYPLLFAALPPYHSRWRKGASKEMVKLLLEHGATFNQAISDNDTLIHYLFERAGSTPLQPFVEKSGLDLGIRDQRGRTLLMAALSSSVKYEYNIVDLQLEGKERLEAEYTPSYLLLANSTLYGKSIDYFAIDNEGRHIFFYIAQNRECIKHAARFLSTPDIKPLIVKKDKAGFSPLHVALKYLNLAVCEQFISEGAADILKPDPNGDTALHHLFRSSSDLGLLERLGFIAKFPILGSQVNFRNSEGNTPLLNHLVSSRTTSGGHLGSLPDPDPPRFFIDHGANFTIANNKKETALHVVSKRSPEGLLPLVEKRYKAHYNAMLFKRLVELGCDPLLEDEGGRTALDLAVAVGNKEILKLYERKN